MEMAVAGVAEPPIALALDCLESQINIAHDLCESLSRRLEVVCAIGEPSKISETKTEPSRNSILTDRIFGRARSLSELNDKLRLLHDRLEL